MANFEETFPNEKAYDAVVKFMLYHCGNCTGHRMSKTLKLRNLKNGAVEGREKAAKLVADTYAGYEVDVNSIVLSEYSIL